MSVQAAITASNTALSEAGIDQPTRDSRALMAAALGIEASRVTLHLRDELDATQSARFWGYIKQRLDHVPVSQIIGVREFYGRRFLVTPDVIDPRPETETLIAVALESSFETVLDLGTGSGCILITLLAERGGATGTGVDVSAAALDVAERNAKALDVWERGAFARSDWFAKVGDTYDLIVSNPPYIALDEMASLTAELSFEPRIALTDEGDGLAAYRTISTQAGAHLNAGGRLIVEIGPSQGAAVAQMFRTAGFDEIEVRSDLDGRDRVVLGKMPLENSLLTEKIGV